MASRCSLYTCTKYSADKPRSPEHARYAPENSARAGDYQDCFRTCRTEDYCNSPTWPRGQQWNRQPISRLLDSRKIECTEALGCRGESCRRPRGHVQIACQCRIQPSSRTLSDTLTVEPGDVDLSWVVHWLLGASASFQTRQPACLHRASRCLPTCNRKKFFAKQSSARQTSSSN
jgi:hypothetical protein